MPARPNRASRVSVALCLSLFFPFSVSAEGSMTPRPDLRPGNGTQVHPANAVIDQQGGYDDFLAALRYKESRGDYQAVNTLNFLGAYQFGEAALVDLGFVRPDRDIYDNDFSGGFTGKHGIRSVRDFLSNPAVQDAAAREWMRIMWRYIEAEGLRQYAWRDVGGVVLSPSGMLAATHLLGSGGLRDYIRSNGRADIRDPYGMPLRTYITDLGGFEIPFAPRRPGFS